MKHNFGVYLTRRAKMKTVGFVIAAICVLSLFVATITGAIGK
jgi:hypothetical protein